jgi:putative hydrolase of HD superfamily
LGETCLADEFMAIWEEYAAKESLESKIVKDADNLDCDLELQEQKARGSNLPQHLEATRESVYQRLHTNTAKALFGRIKSANPHEWHLKTRNRLTAGDWRKETAA